uniref:Ig-like domain-containing protein n=1 Tax=Acanthochromis polyacanthus TaxID=80966 RepID=A0A3Q1FXJ8_9TELE
MEECVCVCVCVCDTHTHTHTHTAQVLAILFMAVVLVDEVETSYCDSTTRRALARICSGGNNMDRIHETSSRVIIGPWFCLLPLSGVHIYQRMDGCEWDDETEELRGFERHGYDGEDFLSFDLNTKTWISHTPKADTTKRKRDRHRSQNQYLKYFLTQKCPEQLLKYLDFGGSALLRTEFPSIFLLHKTSFSLISCLATGFYPNRANLFWRKDGEQLQEDVDHGELLPNHDGTFQMSVDLNIASIAYEDWWRYECVFQLSGVKEGMSITLDQALIRTKPGKTEIISELFLKRHHEAHQQVLGFRGSQSLR